jgi:tRNA U34 5-carboxymethylaminomethyl modifying GTPase MnmE/TrmE
MRCSGPSWGQPWPWGRGRPGPGSSPCGPSWPGAWTSPRPRRCWRSSRPAPRPPSGWRPTHLAGGLGRRLGGLRASLIAILARVEAALDFPEEAAELSPEDLREELAAPSGVGGTPGTYRQGRLLREGLDVVLAGRPNVGKSSLLNRLLDADRAIVTDIPGTTRDVIEESITLAGVALRLSDTAGLREARDKVEELGVARSQERLAQADLVLYLVDGSDPLPRRMSRSWRS